MPKRQRGHSQSRKYKKLCAELDRLKEKIKNAVDSSSEVSSDLDENEHIEFVDTLESGGEEADPLDIEHQAEVPEPNREAIQVDITTNENEKEGNAFQNLGSLPTEGETMGEDIHEELVVRWKAYVLNGLGKSSKDELMAKYPIPKNLPLLNPPQINAEILECLDEPAKKHDKFMSAIQKQIAHALSAIGKVITKNINSNKSSDINEIAEAAQLLTNTHNALSIHRRYKLTPQLSPQCKKVIETSKHDNFLFGEKFSDILKTNQEVKRTGGMLKRRIIQQPSTSTGTSSARVYQHQPRNYLNFQRGKPNTRMRSGREEEKIFIRRRRPTEQGRRSYQAQRENLRSNRM